MDPAARNLLRALRDREEYRSRPPHNVINLQRTVRDVQTRLVSAKQRVQNAARARFAPQRRNVTRYANESVLEVEIPEAGEKMYVLRRSANKSTKYAKFWDIVANAPIYIDKATMVMSWGPHMGKVVKIHEHWTPTGLRR
jgi:hypothetical protein